MLPAEAGGEGVPLDNQTPVPLLIRPLRLGSLTGIFTWLYKHTAGFGSHGASDSKDVP